MKMSASVASLLVFLVAVFAIGSRSVPGYGVSWDEPHSSGFADFNAQEAASVLGLAPPQDPLRFADVVEVARTYPPAIELLHNACSYVWLWSQARSRPTVSDLKAYRGSIEHFVARHFVTFGLSLVAYVALWATARHLGLTGIWSVVPLLLLASAPNYWGHSQFNSKDSGFASAFTIAMWSASLAIPTLLGVERGRRRAAFVLVAFGVATGFATGGRLAGGLIVVIVLVAAIWARPATAGSGAFWARFSLAGLTAGLVLFVIWPTLWVDPVGRLLFAVKTAGSFPGPSSVLFWGAEIGIADLPAYYVPAMLAIKLPELLVIVGGLGLVAAALAQPADVVECARARLLLLWVVVPAFYIAARHVRLYDNERHVLFLVPGLALLAGWALSRMTRDNARLRLLALGVVLVCVLASARSAWLLHPYEYAYFNRFVGGLPGAEGRFDTDYWSLSVHELLSRVPARPQGATAVRVCMVTAAARVMAPPGMQIVETDDEAAYTVCGTRWGLHRKWMETEDLVATAARDAVVFGVLTRARPEGQPASLPRARDGEPHP